MKKSILGAIIVLGLLSVMCNKKEDGLFLLLDYSGNEQWLYSFEYKSQGLFTQKDSTTSMTTLINGTLTGTSADAEKLSLKAGDITITSDMVKDEEKQALIDQLNKATYDLSLKLGYPTVDTTEKLPEGSFHDWDLYRQFAKLLPTLPPSKVKPGFNWERTATLPVRTDQGNLPCEVYRSYTFDSLSTKQDLAYISWQVRYAVEKEVIDSGNIMKQIPVAGFGAGSAVLDVKKNFIKEAKMNFESPVASIGDITVNWYETAVITLNSK